MIGLMLLNVRFSFLVVHHDIDVFSFFFLQHPTSKKSNKPPVYPSTKPKSLSLVNGSVTKPSTKIPVLPRPFRSKRLKSHKRGLL